MIMNAAKIVATHEKVWLSGRKPTEFPPWKHLQEEVTTEARLPVSEHNSLALAGGAGSENDGREILGRYDDILILGVAVRKELLALIDVLLKIGDIEICVHGSTYLFYLLDCRSIVLGIEDSLALALVELNGKILCRKLGVKRNADYLSEKVRKKRDYPLIGVLADNGDIAVLDAVGKHICAQAVDVVPDIIEVLVLMPPS